MLRGQGLELQHLVRCTVTLADMADWPAFNEVYREFFGSNGLALGVRVEIECIAAAPCNTGLQSKR